MNHIRSLLLIRSGNNAVALSLPALACVLAFITYSATGHELDPAIVFTSLTLFQLIRMPLMWMPMGLSAMADAASAVERLYDVFVSEVLSDVRKIDTDLNVALQIENASFVWDGSAPGETIYKKKGQLKNHDKSEDPVSPTILLPEDTYKLQSINVSIPRGQLCAIVGSIGSGKSSLLQGMIGEMRRESRNVTFGGNVSYCPQSAWIQVRKSALDLCPVNTGIECHYK